MSERASGWVNVSHPLLSLGDWSCGKRSGHGSETSQYGTYEGGWRNGMKYGQDTGWNNLPRTVGEREKACHRN